MKITLVASTVAAVLGLATNISPASAFVVPAGGSHLGKPPTKADFLAKRDGGSIRLPLRRVQRNVLDTSDKVLEFAQRQKGYVESKFGVWEDRIKKRQSIGLAVVGPDTFYIAQVSVGTPAQNFNLVLDTGSSDLWIVSSDCTSSTCRSVPNYNPNQSSTSIASDTRFDITYGLGGVTGVLYADTVSLAGYTVFNTTVADGLAVEDGTFFIPASGIMGMGFQGLATSAATPFWEVLVKSDILSTPAFSFQLSSNKDAATASTEAPGGIFTLGEVDSSQYTGEITYMDVPQTTVGQKGYWSIYLDSITINNEQISTTDDYAVIDTGTTLIGGPETTVESIYAQVDGARRLTSQGGDDSGYYAIPCSNTVSISFTFGGREFTMESADFVGSELASGYCLGAIFSASFGSSGLSWVIGDAFLKNVFSVYEYSPARIGFADLVGGTAQTLPTTFGAVPSATSVSGSAATSGINIPTQTGSPAQATGTGIVGGSGLPDPVASTGFISSTPSALPSSSRSTSSTPRSPQITTIFTTSTSSQATGGSNSAAGPGHIGPGLFGAVVSVAGAIVAGALLVI